MDIQNYIGIKKNVDNFIALHKRAILLLVVSKGQSVEDMLTLAKSCNVRTFAESRVQEAASKIAFFKEHFNEEVEFQFIGNLQKNKLKKIVENFSLIHSFDKEEYLEPLNRYAKELGKVQKILLQVNIAGEEQKGGVSPKELFSLYEKSKAYENIIAQGLMFMPPYTKDNNQNLPYFKKARELFMEINKRDSSFKELSMGMSHDYEVTMQYGATILRVGSAIFS